jgi:tRNA dimethylallyltransferase
MPRGATVICLMGPTASGKTETAVRLVEQFPLDIVSVDSALVYRGMDVGTAKPDAETLARAPHRLVDIRDPEQAYSAGAFVRDATREIESILAAGRVPLLVGGTMLYFRSLTEGIAELPDADAAVRARIDADAARRGWPALHAELAAVDPDTAGRIEPGDRQRIQRALEVYRTTGRTLTEWHSRAGRPAADYAFEKIALLDADRARLHRRIEARFLAMLDAGFLDELEALRMRPGLSADSPSMRSVGYRQLWAYLDGSCDLDTAIARGQAATRQLAKRQITWLRSEAGLTVFDPLEKSTPGAISRKVAAKLNK